ncbi:MAG: NADH-quinone oxidoreductase subunit H [Deltaproteobacteria bacterium]|nr:NADH-quinone oxidoreductase subunit H [Deltaproteobacteria bacterium]
MLFLVGITLAKIVCVLAVAVAAFAPLLIWAERRQSAMIQDRLGPMRANIQILGMNITLGGMLHPVADALKLFWKEDFVPPKADKFLHAIAPMIALIPALAAFTVIPFGNTLYLDALNQVLPADGAIESAHAIQLQIATIDVGILFIFAVAGTGVVGAAIGGYASDNKFSLIGGVRAASQMVSYEVVLGLTLIPCFMVYQSLRLEDMAMWQHENTWGILNPALFFAFILYFVAAVAENKRVPFDLPEGESELVGGYLTEYSSMRFGMFFMGEFIEVVVLGALAVVIFFGAWDVPFLTRSGFDVFGHYLPMVHWLVALIQVVVFILKIIVLMWFQLMVRWTLPRFRYDQVMKLCWKGLLPLALINILFTGVLLLAWRS